ncbi:MAG: hypothetical protein ABIQ72_17280 [Usitatibacter sp.]
MKLTIPAVVALVLAFQAKADSPYPNAVTVESPLGVIVVSVEATDCVLTEVSAIDPAKAQFRTYKTRFPWGLVSFTPVGDCGTPTRVKIKLPAAIPANGTFHSFGYTNADFYGEPRWLVLPTTISGDVASFELRDDRDGEFNSNAQDSGADSNSGIHVLLGGIGVPINYADMYWGGPSQNGWGMSLVQHGERMFGVLFGYDTFGRPTWYSMPNMVFSTQQDSLASSAYSPRSAPYFAYGASSLVVGDALGTFSFSFDSKGALFMNLPIGPVTTLKRQPFGPPSTAVVPQVGDMWWGGPSQNGWGIAIMQQGASLFSVWYTYDVDGTPTWFVMPTGTWTSPDTYEGRVFVTSGSRTWAEGIYDADTLGVIDVGSFKMQFAGNYALMTYDVQRHFGTLELTRQPF